MKPDFFILSLAVIVTLSGCAHHYVLFSVNNQSSKQIYFTYSKSYPDTSINIGYVKPGTTATPSVLLAQGQQYTISAPSSLDDYFASIPSDTLQVFIYDANIVNSVPWDSVVKNYLILKRYELSLDDIKKMKNVIVYP